MELAYLPLHILVEFTLYLLIALLFSAALERIRPYQRGVKLFKKEFRQEAGFAFLSALLNPLFKALALWLTADVLAAVLPMRAFEAHLLTLPLFAQVTLALIALDFTVYWRHRFTHHFAWRAHSIHHAAKELTALTKLRLHPIDVTLALLANAIVLSLIGFTTEAIAYAGFALMLYDYLAHTNVRIGLPKPLRYVFGCPTYHRWHHALEEEAHNKNYAILFSLWDVLFGTFYYPDDRLPKGYGLSQTNGSYTYPEGFRDQLVYPMSRKKR